MLFRRRNHAWEQYLRFCRAVGEARLTRRELIRLGLISAGALLTPGAVRVAGGAGGGDDRVSPRVTPFKDPFRMPGVDPGPPAG